MKPLSYCVLLLLSRVKSQELPTVTQRSLKNFSHHGHHTNQLHFISSKHGESKHSGESNKQGPVLFPNDAPPPPPPPLIVTSRPLLESIARSDVGNNTGAPINLIPYLASVKSKDYKPELPEPVFDYTIIPSPARVPYDELKKSRLNDLTRDSSEEQSTHTLPRLFKVLADHAKDKETKHHHKITYQNTPSARHQHHPKSKDKIEQDSEFDHTNNYAFSYKVKDKNGEDFSHTQRSSGSATNGEYRVRLPDGRMQIVSYTADDNGYKADVRYNDEKYLKIVNDIFDDNPQAEEKHKPHANNKKPNELKHNNHHILKHHDNTHNAHLKHSNAYHNANSNLNNNNEYFNQRESTYTRNNELPQTINNIFKQNDISYSPVDDYSKQNDLLYNGNNDFVKHTDLSQNAYNDYVKHNDLLNNVNHDFSKHYDFTHNSDVKKYNDLAHNDYVKPNDFAHNELTYNINNGFTKHSGSNDFGNRNDLGHNTVNNFVKHNRLTHINNKDYTRLNSLALNVNNDYKKHNGLTGANNHLAQNTQHDIRHNSYVAYNRQNDYVPRHSQKDSSFKDYIAHNRQNFLTHNGNTYGYAPPNKANDYAHNRNNDYLTHNANPYLTHNTQNNLGYNSYGTQNRQNDLAQNSYNNYLARQNELARNNKGFITHNLNDETVQVNRNNERVHNLVNDNTQINRNNHNLINDKLPLNPNELIPHNRNNEYRSHEQELNDRSAKNTGGKLNEENDYIYSDSKEYSDETLEYDTKNKPHISKFFEYVSSTAATDTVSSVKPSFEELKPIFLSKNVYNTVQKYDTDIQVNPTAETFETTTERVVIIGTKAPKLYTNIHRSLKHNIPNFNPPKIIQITTPKSYLVTTIASLKNKIHLANKPVLSDNYVDKIKKYISFK